MHYDLKNVALLKYEQSCILMMQPRRNAIIVFGEKKAGRSCVARRS